MTELDDRLSQHLQSAAAGLRVAEAGAETVSRQGRRRRVRSRIAVAGVTVSVVVVAAVGAFALVDRDDETIVQVGSPAGDGVGEGLDSTAVESALEWREAAPDSAASAIGYVNGVEGSDGALYAVSTEPGRFDYSEANPQGPGQALYRSTDGGVNWEPVSSNADLWIADLDASADRIYAVGTAPAQAGTTPTARTGDLVVASSTDGGTTWTNALLPLDVVPDHSVSGVYGAQVVVGPAGVVTAVPTTVQRDMEALVPGVDLRWGWQPTDTGLAVYGEPEDFDASSRLDWCPQEWVLEGPSDEPNGTGGYFRCVHPETDDASFEFGAGLVIGSIVAAEYTWADLGLESYADLVSTTVQMFFSADGSTFEAVAIPAGVGINGSIELVTTETGFLAAVNSYATPESTVADSALLRSGDGRSWTATAPPASGGGYPAAFGVIGDRIVWVSTDFAGRSVIESTADGTTWDAIELSSDIAGLIESQLESTSIQVWIERAAVGSGGAAVVLSVVETTQEGASATTIVPQDSSDLVVTGPAGQQLPVAPPIIEATIPTVVDGPPVPSTTDTTVAFAAGYAPPGIRRIVLHSVDGVSWSVTPMEDITDTPILQVNSLFVTGASVRMIVQPAQVSGDPALPTQLTLIGEPKA